MRILVTGAAGFLGRHVISHISMEPKARIFAISRSIRTIGNDQKINYISGDLSSYRFTEDLICEIKPDIVFHLAGLMPGIRDNFEDEMIRQNLVSTLNILESLSNNVPECRVLLVGSAAEYGKLNQSDNPVNENKVCNPSGHYALSKYFMSMAGLDYYRRKKLKVIIARLFNIIGPGISSENVVGAFLQKANTSILKDSKPKVQMGNLSSIRDYMDVRDVARLFIQMVENGPYGEIYNVASGIGIKTEYLINKLVSFYSQTIVVDQDISLSMKKMDVPIAVGKIEKIQKNFNFMPEFNLDNSLYDTWKFSVNNL